MKCKLCEKQIAEYHPELNHMQISESHAVDICQDCIDKVVKWQGSIVAKLFPTKALKKRYGEK